MYRTNTKKLAKRLRAATFAIKKSDKLMGSKSKKSNITIAIWKNGQLNSAPKITSHYGCTNNIFSM